MNENDIIYLASRTLSLMMLLSLPVVIVSAFVGIVVGLFQAVTQIQDQAISFAVRIVAVGVTLLMTSRWVGTEIQHFAVMLFERISQ